MTYNSFKTKDFYLSAFLLANGHKIIRTDMDAPQRLVFYFEDFENRENLVRNFLCGKTLIEPQVFIASIKTLKQIIYSC